MFRFPIVALILSLLTPAGLSAQGYKPSGSLAKSEPYVFAIHPYTNPQDMFAAYDPIMAYLEQKIPGTRFQVEASRDYADYEAKIAGRRFHFGLPNPFQTVYSLEHGYHVIAKMTPDEDFRGLIVARADKKIQSPRDLAGKKLCFPPATAVAGTMLPMLWLHEQGLNIKEFQPAYVGSQFSSILNAFSGDYAACGSTSRFWRTWARDNPDKAKELVVLWRTDSLPHNAVIARDDVPPALAQKVAAALIGMDKDPELDQSRFKADQAHFEAGSNAAYKRMSEFLKRYDQAIGLPAQMKLQGK